MKRLTTAEVAQQKERFDALVQKTNLIKLGELLMRGDVKEGHHYSYNFITRYLSLFANVGRSFIHPDHIDTVDAFYGSIIYRFAINAYIDSIQITV